MGQRSLDRFIGEYCKIVTKEPGGTKASVVTGFVKDIDHDFITIESSKGLGVLNIKSIVAIKPRQIKS
jgi:ribosome maturation factor RimP